MRRGELNTIRIFKDVELANIAFKGIDSSSDQYKILSGNNTGSKMSGIIMTNTTNILRSKIARLYIQSI